MGSIPGGGWSWLQVLVSRQTVLLDIQASQFFLRSSPDTHREFQQQEQGETSCQCLGQHHAHADELRHYLQAISRYQPVKAVVADLLGVWSRFVKRLSRNHRIPTSQDACEKPHNGTTPMFTEFFTFHCHYVRHKVTAISQQARMTRYQDDQIKEG